MNRQDFRERLGAELKGHRLRLKMSQEDVAVKLKVSYQQVQKYEYGRSKLSIERLIEFAEIFNVSIHTILRATLTD